MHAIVDALARPGRSAVRDSRLEIDDACMRIVALEYRERVSLTGPFTDSASAMYSRASVIQGS